MPNNKKKKKGGGAKKKEAAAPQLGLLSLREELVMDDNKALTPRQVGRGLAKGIRLHVRQFDRRTKTAAPFSSTCYSHRPMPC